MTTPARPRRAATALVAASFTMLALVLGLWQGVDQACGTDDDEPREALLACDAVPMAETDTLGSGIEVSEPVTEVSVRG